MTVSELLNKKSRWTTGVSARSFTGSAVLFDSENAVKWCVSGAILKCYIGSRAAFFLDKANQYAKNKGYQDLPHFNDNVSFESVRQLIEELGI